MKVLVTLILIFSCCTSFSQYNSFEYWERRILSNEGFRELKNAIQNENFDIFYNKKDIPKSLIDTLKLWDGDFAFSNPNEPFRATDEISDPEMPCRQIMIILKNHQNIFVSYKHGGIGFHHHVIWAKFENGVIKDIWIGFTFVEIDNIDKIKMVLSENPEGLNTNIICY